MSFGSNERSAPDLRDASARTFAPPWLPPALVMLALSLLLFPVSGQDDFFITLWPATTLAEQGELLNYNAQRVEQSSTLLWTALLAVGTALSGRDPASFARALSLLAALACAWGLTRWFEPFAPRFEGGRPASRAAWMLACAAPFVYWAASGTEMPLMALLCLAWVACVHAWLHRSQGRARVGIALVSISAAVVLTRPEGGAVLLASLVGLALVRGLCADRSPRAYPLGLPLLAVAGSSLLLAWARLAYFGLAWPLPVHAKIDGSAQRASRVLDGLRYLVADNGLTWLGMPALLACIALALVITPDPRPRLDPTSDRQRGEARELALLTSLVAGAYLSFAVTAGGDWMEGGRFIVPALPCLMLGLGLGLSLCLDEPSAARASGCLLLLGASSIVLLAAHPKNRALPLWRSGQLEGMTLGPSSPSRDPYELGTRPWTERSNTTQLRDLAVIAFLDALVERAEQAELDPLTLSSHQMGFVAYRLARKHPGALRFIDAAGLVEPTLLDCEAIADRVTHNAGGVWREGYAYDPHLKVRFLLEDVGDCAPGAIDLLYELGIPDEAQLRAHGLRLVYVQDGRLFGRPVYTFVAVREQLLAPLGLSAVERVDYRSERGQLELAIGERE